MPNMQKYNKLWGGIIGGLFGLFAIKFNLPPDMLSPELTDQLGTLVGSLLGLYFAPPNAA